MGLDVYLHELVPSMTLEQIETLSNQQNDLEYNIPKWKEIDEILGAAEDRIEEPSTKYPEHLFKIGYFRSSYNNSGINRILRERVGEDLYSIFEVDRSSLYRIVPDWTNALKQVNKVISTLKAEIKHSGKFSVHETPDNWRFLFSSPPNINILTQRKALDIFMEQYVTWKEGRKASPFEGNGYGNGYGVFWDKKPLKLRAEIYGYRKSWGEQNNIPITYLIIEGDGKELNWYLEALEIVKETIEYVLSSPHPERFYLTWSS